MATWQQKVDTFVKEEIQPFSPQTAIKKGTHSSALLAKGFGGRIGQNQPTEIVINRRFKQDLKDRHSYGIQLKTPQKANFKLRKVNGKFDAVIIVDIDISGCYAESQRVQVLPIGRPIIGGLRLDTISENNYPILGNFLKTWKVDVNALCNSKFENYQEYRDNWHLWGELEYGAFNLFIEVPELKNPLDLLSSWIHPSKKIDHKILCKLLADAAKGDEKAIDKIKQGQTKKLLNEVGASPVNFDVLEWLFFHATPALRKEILSKARVIAFVIYPKSLRITSDKETPKARFKNCWDKLVEIRKNWKPTNSLDIDVTDKFILYSEQYRDCHYWFGETIGDIILNKILGSRKKAQWVEKKSPADLVAKLFCNTHYGVSISPLFSISNVCVGNNITARCRVLAWMMEKALLGYPTITDGCFYQLNRVLKPYERNIDSSCINMDSKKSPLGQYNYGTQAQPFNFNFEDEKFSYSGVTKEYVMKKKRIYSLATVTQTCKNSGNIDTFEWLVPLDKFGKAVDIIANQANEHIKSCFPLMTVAWIETNRLKAVALKEEYNKLPSSERNESMCKVIEIPRQGMADLEIKDYYHTAANHGMANYLLISEKVIITGRDVFMNQAQNEEWGKEHIAKGQAILDKIKPGSPEVKTFIKEQNEINRVFKEGLAKEAKELRDKFVKENQKIIGNLPIEFKEGDNEKWNIEIVESYSIAFRGYESSKPHVGVTTINNEIERTDRYMKDNPAMDFMKNLVKNPNAVPRQYTTIKGRSISIGDYKNNSKKFEELGGLLPGDMMKVCILFTEFAASQFTYKNKEQYYGWIDDVTKSKKKYGQSIEAWFTNSDDSLRFFDMCYWVADAIERGIKSPIKELNSYGKRAKPKVGNPTIKLDEELRYHPEFFTYAKSKLMLGGKIVDELIETDKNSEDSNEKFVETEM